MNSASGHLPGKFPSAKTNFYVEVGFAGKPLIMLHGGFGTVEMFAVEFFNLLGGSLKDAGWNGENLIPSQLAILPGSTHYNIVFRADLLLPVLAPFLDKEQ
jgi:hypothetical protein